MYYILSDELEKPKFDAYINATLLNSNSVVTPNIFGKGTAVSISPDKKYFLKINPDYSKIGKFRDRMSVLVHNSEHLFLASEKLQELLKATSNGQTEFFPVTFEYNETFVNNYTIVNILNKIECIDYEESEITFESYNDNDEGEGEIYGIESLVLNKDIIPPHLNIFLLGRANSSVIIIHERLKRKIEELSLSGFVFCLPEDFSI